MTTDEFFTSFKDFLSEDERTQPFVDTFKDVLFDQKYINNVGKFFTRTGYRVALMFFEQYGKKHEQFKNPDCFRTCINWNQRNIEKIKERLSKEYDVVMYIGKENCDESCNFAIFDPNIVTTVELMGSIEAFLDSLEA